MVHFEYAVVVLGVSGIGHIYFMPCFPPRGLSSILLVHKSYGLLISMALEFLILFLQFLKDSGVIITSEHNV